MMINSSYFQNLNLYPPPKTHTPTGQTHIKDGSNGTPSFFGERNIHGKRRTRKRDRKETVSANAPPTPIDRFAGRTLCKLDRKMATSHRADYRLTRHSPYGLPSSRRMSSSSEFEFEAAILIKERVGLSATF